ncbi:MAG TPA: hypothetical protein VGR63_13200 [Casimicrobiaceae bacterium]|nr:hypothetical protein [Casimicrobiaceae bacterium]
MAADATIGRRRVRRRSGLPIVARYRTPLEAVMDMRTELRQTHTTPVEATTRVVAESANESSQSSISWSAVIAGAVVSAALALVLLILCVGLKLTTVSPWVANTSSTMLGVSTIVAAILVQLIASSIGGYVAGRLRTKWVQVHDDEVYFRDTAHGFIVWALATVVTAGFLTSAATTAVGSAAGAAGTLAVATGMAPGNVANVATNAVTQPASAAAAPSPAAPPSDGTGTATPAAAPAPAVAAAPPTPSPQAVEHARSVAAQSALWTFLALLVGAFAASLAATIGGRQRDRLAVALRGA